MGEVPVVKVHAAADKKFSIVLLKAKLVIILARIELSHISCDTRLVHPVLHRVNLSTGGVVLPSSIHQRSTLNCWINQNRDAGDET